MSIEMKQNSFAVYRVYKRIFIHSYSKVSLVILLRFFVPYFIFAELLPSFVSHQLSSSHGEYFDVYSFKSYQTFDRMTSHLIDVAFPVGQSWL